MSEREVWRVEVLNEVQSGRRTVAAAASVLGISERQAYRLVARYQENGGFGLVHKARGRTSNRSHNPGIRKFAVELVKTHYADFGPTLATEALAERHAIHVGRETLRLRLAGINDINAGNAFLPGFLERFNERFAVRADKAENLHRPLHVPQHKLQDILCHREQRYIGAQLSFHYDRKQIILDQTELSKRLAGKYVELYELSDRPLEVRWKACCFPIRVFRKDQRVSHTDIVENKRLGLALTIVKAQQDLTLATKVMTNSEKTGHKKNPRVIYGPDFVEKTRSRAAVEMVLLGKRGTKKTFHSSQTTRLAMRLRISNPTFQVKSADPRHRYFVVCGGVAAFGS